MNMRYSYWRLPCNALYSVAVTLCERWMLNWFKLTISSIISRVFLSALIFFLWERETLYLGICSGSVSRPLSRLFLQCPATDCSPPYAREYDKCRLVNRTRWSAADVTAPCSPIIRNQSEANNYRHTKLHEPLNRIERTNNVVSLHQKLVRQTKRRISWRSFRWNRQQDFPDRKDILGLVDTARQPVSPTTACYIH
ncbi:hypothetical protein P879_00223 [Paragonimus westermani]|uniref:Uncharacterized protein n=1 Tax=Paragonimus westermani TaxID=34504 RepID=A0A8T0DWP5_9TREM|nr:hypothetical protein P879_00223 [Paragonimus westermani]